VGGAIETVINLSDRGNVRSTSICVGKPAMTRYYI